MTELQRNALNVLLRNTFGFDLDDLADNKFDILPAVIDHAYEDVLQGVLEVDPAKGEDAKTEVKTLVDEMLNHKIDFEKKGLDMWYNCLCDVIVEDYENAGLTDENPMTTELAQKWVSTILDDLAVVVDTASLAEDLQGSYSFLYYKEFVETFRDSFPVPGA